MTVIVDTGVLYADHDTDATRHEEASAALHAVYDGEFGQPYISDYIYDEAVTLTVNYPTLLALTRSLSVGLPASKTRFAGTTAVPAGSAVSTGIPSE